MLFKLSLNLFIISIININLVTKAFSEENKVLNMLAIVNEEIITSKDLEDRLSLFYLTSRSLENEENNDEFLKSIDLKSMLLINMIFEKSLIKNLESRGVYIEDNIIDKVIRRMANDNSMTFDSLITYFQFNNINLDSLREKIRAQILWSDYIKSQYSRIHIHEEEIDYELEKSFNNSYYEHFSYIKIFYPLSSLKKEDYANIENSIKELKAINNKELSYVSSDEFLQKIPNLKGRKKETISAISENLIENNLLNNLKRLRIGEFTAILTKSGLIIMKLLDKFYPRKDLNENSLILLSEVNLNLNKGKIIINKDQYINEVITTLERSSDNYENFLKKLEKFDLVSKETKTRFGSLTDEIKGLIRYHGIGRCLPIIDTNDSLTIVIPFLLDKGKFELPTRNFIRDTLYNRKISYASSKEKLILLSKSYYEIMDKKTKENPMVNILLNVNNKQVIK